MTNTIPSKTTKVLVGVLSIVGVGLVLACGGGGKESAPATVVTTAPAVPTPSQSPASVVVPDLVGQNAAAAQDVLKRAGFAKVQLGSVDENDKVVLLASNWKVVEQSTPAGATATTDTLIVLGCTKKH